MLKELTELYNDTITTKSIVITTAQQTSIQNQINREFFSWVQPIYFLANKNIDELEMNKKPYTNLRIEDDEYGLGIGKFKIECFRVFTNATAIKILPLDYSQFKLEVEYQADYILTCEYFLMKSQKDNMDLLGGIGIQEIPYDPLSIQELREILEAHYGTSTAQSVELDEMNSEC